MNMWLRCPRQWEYRYVKGLKMPPSGALIEGGCYHKALEVNFRQKITSFEDMLVDECLDAYSDEWEARLKAEELIDWQGKPLSFYKNEGVVLVTEYMASISQFVQPVRVEAAGISEIAGVVFVCIPDLVDRNTIVIDHKTSARDYQQKDVDNDIQLSAQAFLLGRQIVAHFHVAVKGSRPHIQISRTFRTHKDIEWWYEMAVGIIAQMKTGFAPPRSVDAFGKRGYWCSEKWCGFYGICQKGLTRSIFV